MVKIKKGLPQVIEEEISWVPGVEEDNLGCRNPGSADCNLAVCSDVCAGWTRY